MGKFVISKSKKDDYYFNLKADNGQVILTSEMYPSKSSCENGIASVKKNHRMISAMMVNNPVAVNSASP